MPGVLSTNGGNDFKQFIRTIDEIGYCCAWRILDAQYVRVDGFPRAVPQRRRRLFVVGHTGGWEYPAEVLFEPHCLQGNTPPRRKTWKSVAENAKNCTGTTSAEGGIEYIAVDGYNACVVGDRVNSLTRNAGYVDAKAAVMEVAYLIGNGQVNQPASEIAQTIDTMHDVQAVACFEWYARDLRVKETEYSPTIKQSAGTGGGNLPLVEEFIQRYESGEIKIVSARVRRLLPIECERLMGFPEDYTKIPYRGKPQENCPDSPRYRACGNSMCVNVMRWIGMRIEMVERKRKNDR